MNLHILHMSAGISLPLKLYLHKSLFEGFSFISLPKFMTLLRGWLLCVSSEMVLLQWCVGSSENTNLWKGIMLYKRGT
jgi:hypothetical protein